MGHQIRVLPQQLNIHGATGSISRRSCGPRDWLWMPPAAAMDAVASAGSWWTAWKNLPARQRFARI